jgi:RNA polymerase sigma-70 factor, ECF subfamily
LAALTPEQRAAIVLVDIEGYPVDEVAKILEVPSGTVKSRCARGRAKLVPLLAHLAIGNQRLRANVEPNEPAPSSQEAPSSLEAAPSSQEAPPREDLR